jgi:hypothetical protein
VNEEDLEECSRLNHKEGFEDYPSSFDCNIYSEIIDTENGNNCTPYQIEFEKFHCMDKGASPKMSYGFNGCNAEGEITYLTNLSPGLYSVTISFDQYYIDFRLKDDSGILHKHTINGYEIKTLTEFGEYAKGIVITFEVPNYKARIRPSAI